MFKGVSEQMQDASSFFFLTLWNRENVEIRKVLKHLRAFRIRTWCSVPGPVPDDKALLIQAGNTDSSFS